VGPALDKFCLQRVMFLVSKMLLKWSEITCIERKWKWKTKLAESYLPENLLSAYIILRMRVC
jgi:hypothetical protein